MYLQSNGGPTARSLQERKQSRVSCPRACRRRDHTEVLFEVSHVYLVDGHGGADQQDDQADARPVPLDVFQGFLGSHLP